MKLAPLLILLFAAACATSPPKQHPLSGVRAPDAAKVQPTFVQGGPAEFLISQQFVLTSKQARRDYLIQICLPITMQPNARVEDVEKSFPKRDAAAIYVLDGGSDFGTYCGIARDVFVVGITHIGFIGQDMMDARPRDFMHLKQDRMPVAGRGAEFAAFLTDEVKPFIESHFPVDPKKAALTGQSLGGLFTLHVLADTPNAFWAYMICTPSVGYDAAVIEKARETALKSKGQRVYFGYDGPTPADKPLFDRVQAALTVAGGGFTIETHAFPDEDHGSVGPAFASRAVNWFRKQLAAP